MKIEKTRKHVEFAQNDKEAIVFVYCSYFEP